MILVKGKAIGQRKPLFADFSVNPPESIGEGGHTTLRDLIGLVVRAEIKAFEKRQADRQLIKVLTKQAIEEGEAAGKIESGLSEVEPQSVDAEQAIATALQAFEDGMFLVVVDELEQRNLDSEVFVRPDSQLTFVRLTMLAGG